MCLGFSFAAYPGFLGGVSVPQILKDAACSSAAGQSFRHRWARSHQPAPCPRHPPVVTLVQDPSCPVCRVKPAESLSFPAAMPLTAPASGSVGNGGLGCVAAPGQLHPRGGTPLCEQWLVKEGLPWELAVGLARCPPVMLWVCVGVGPMPVAFAETAGPEGVGTLSSGGVGRPGGDQEADVLSHGRAGVVEPSSITAGILSGDCLVSFSVSPRLPQWRTGS